MKITVDKNLSSRPTDFSWQFGFGNDHAHQIHRTDMCEHMKLAHDELGIKYVRFHGIFNDDMYTYQTFRNFAPMPGNKHKVREMNFRQIGHVLDNVLNCGLKPFVELSFMPNHLANGKAQGLHYPNNIHPPKNYERWQEYIKSFIAFLIDRYGKDEVASWYFEVWNEPDLKIFFKGSQKEYFKLYRATVTAVKSVCPELKVGGPSTSACKWVDEFTSFCKQTNTPYDFISTHHYPGDAFGNLITAGDYPKVFKVMLKSMKEKAPLGEAMGKMFFFPENARKVPKGALTQMDDELVAKADGKPLFVSEWNSMAIFAAPIHDEKYSAAFVLKTVLDLKNTINGYMFWCISDIFEELLQLNRPFHGGYGIVSNDGIPKPNFWAFKILSKLYGERLNTPFRTNEDVEYAVFREGKNLQIVVYAQTNDCLESKSFDVELEVNMPAQSVSVECIDDEHCNPKRLWQEMGSPDNLKSDEVEQIKAKSALKEEQSPFEISNGTTVIRTALKSNDIKLFTVYGA